MKENTERMLKGLIYDPSDEELLRLRKNAHDLCREYNALSEDSPKRNEILMKMGMKLGEGVYLQGPIQFDYGCFTTIGDGSYANFNLVVLDVCPVTIGKNVFMGTNVSLLTPLHPLRYQDRNTYVCEKGYVTDKEYGKPITIGDNCWIASSVTICAGVTIGEGSVIGAGSLVLHDIPPHYLAAGNPCRIIRKITEKDRIPEELLR